MMFDFYIDGVMSSQGANWANLQLWQDLNQDGRSQAGGLSTLDALGISSINVGATQNSRVLADGNQNRSGRFPYADGSTGGMADINLAVDTFHRTFMNTISANDDVWRIAA